MVNQCWPLTYSAKCVRRFRLSDHKYFDLLSFLMCCISVVWTRQRRRVVNVVRGKLLDMNTSFEDSRDE